ncbi:6036_t:CDS:2 [Scutellospora calospora]|uniref:6036_t:CDS:1 n=1 Tax=Scutellospora calospora TaxID=85575 RepID=A0ACA9K2H6_9GLOM|nr:6036_t:CDS:2 [Scutellospora calospora]
MESVKDDHDQMQSGNQILQTYINNLMSSNVLTSGNGGKKDGVSVVTSESNSPNGAKTGSSLKHSTSIKWPTTTNNESTYINLNLSPVQPVSLNFPNTSQEIISEESTDSIVIESSEIK